MEFALAAIISCVIAGLIGRDAHNPSDVDEEFMKLFD